MAIDEINAKGGIPGPSGRARGRGLRPAATPAGGAEGAQADRQRQGRFSARQRQLGACARHGRRFRTKRASSTSCPAATPTRSPARAATGTCSASATPRRWRRTPSPTRWSRTTERNSTTSRPTTPSATRWKPAWSRRSTALGGERVGGDLVPLGTVDFSSYLIKAQAANPDVIVFLVQGDDMLERPEAGGSVRLDRTRSISRARSRRWSRSKVCRRRRASGPG